MVSVTNILSRAGTVRRTHGIGILRQLREILRLRAGIGRLGAQEYYDYRLYLDTFSYNAKRQFLGWRGERQLEFLNDRAWHALANDKLAFYAAMRGLGIPIPRIVAIYQMAHRYFGAVPCFSTAHDLANFLRKNDEWPLFAKPVHSAYGKGTSFIRGYEPARDELTFAGAEPRSVDVYVANLLDPGGLGHMFQEVLEPHPAMEAVCGKRLSSVRLMTLYGANGATIHRAIWKIPAGANITDNYHHGVAGNMISAVDLMTGIAAEAVIGIGAGWRVVDKHPDTGSSLRDVALPQWDEVKDIALRGTRTLPGLQFQHWDVAFARNGPTVLEVNLYAGGGTDISQLACRVGLLDPQLVDLMRQNSR